MPTALLAGAFGQGNLGDEALVEAFSRALPDWRLVPTVRDQATASARSAGPVTAGVPAHRPTAVARHTLSADAVIIGGGSVFKLLNPSSGRRPTGLLASAGVLVAAASCLGRPVAMVGVGAGRLDGTAAARYSRFLVRHADLLILRDEESAATLHLAGVRGPFRVGADPAWTLLQPPEAARVPTERLLVIPSGEAADGVGGRAAYVDRLADALARVTSAGVEVVLQPWQRSAAGRPDDVELVAALAERLGVEVLDTPRSLPEAVDSMRSVAGALCYRFHSMLAAAAAGTPFAAVGHEQKLVGLARRLGQRSVDQTASADQLSAEALAALRCPGPSPAAVKEEIDRAEEGLRLMRVLLAGGPDDADRLGALPLVPWPG